MKELKRRSVSNELKVFRSLNTRMKLSEKESKHHLNLEKGYQGEKMFDQLTEKLQCDIFILNDLCLEFNNSFFQIDTLIISQETIYVFEVKNNDGDYIYESESFKTLSNNEIKNPLDQLKRCIILLRQLLQSLGFHLPIEGYVIFINPEFTLFQAPLNKPIVFQSQLNRFMKKFDHFPSKLNNLHKKLAEQLISLHQSKSPYTKFPSYEYVRLKKGIICSKCHSFMLPVGEKTVVCDQCGFKENVESAILRSVEEVKLLFPDSKITTNCIYDWCQIIKSKKKISRILKRRFTLMGYGKWTYYE